MADNKRRVLTEEEISLLLTTKPSEYTLSKLRDWLAYREKSEPVLGSESEFTIPDYFRTPPTTAVGVNEWDVRHAPNWKEIKTTTVGRFIVNNLLACHSEALRTTTPYVDKPFDKGTIEDYDQLIMDNALDGKISSEDIAAKVDMAMWLGYAPTSFVTSSMTIDTIRATPSMRKRKKEALNSEIGDKIREGDMNALEGLEKELINMGKAELMGVDPGFDIFASGARGSINNNYKLTAVMRGAIRKSDDPNQISISTASLEEGIPIDEIPLYADIMVQASFGRSMSTANGGYIAKQINAAFQNLTVNPDATSDCGTNLTEKILVDKPREYLFTFFYDDKNVLTQVTPDNMNSLKGKYLRMRRPRFCADQEKFCAHCFGTLQLRMGVTNVGLMANRIGSTLLNASLKAFHDSSLKRIRIDISNYIMPL